MTRNLGELLPRELSPDSLVIQANSLARGYYPIELQFDATRLLIASLAKIERDTDLLGDVRLTVSEMKNTFPDYRKHHRYSEKWSVACDQLMGLIAHINLGGGNWDKIALIRRASYRNGCIEISFDPEARPLLLRMTSGNFTSYPVGAISNLRSTAQLLLYQWAKSFAHRGTWTANPSTVRIALNKPVDSYPEERNFNRWVLAPAVEFLNNDDRCDLVISYQLKRAGRRPDVYEFKVSMKQDAAMNPANTAVIEMLVAEGILRSVATKKVKELGAITLLHMIAQMKWRVSRTDMAKIEDPTRYLGKLIAEGALPDGKGPEFKKILDGLTLALRLKTFNSLSEEAKTVHLRAFADSLSGRAKVDWDTFHDVNRSGPLQQAWYAFINRFIANDDGAIILKRVKTATINVDPAALDGDYLTTAQDQGPKAAGARPALRSE